LTAGVLRYVPGGLGKKLRYSYYRKRLKWLGRGATIDEGVFILNPKYVSIGDFSWIDKGVVLLAGPLELGQKKLHRRDNSSYNGEPGELRIGSRCHIAPYSIIQAHSGVEIKNNASVAAGGKIYSASNHYRNVEQDDGVEYKFSVSVPDDEQYLIVGPVVMEENSGLGLNSVVLPGVTIGRNSWVAVNSSVVTDVPPDTIASGSPAKALKSRLDRRVLSESDEAHGE
jgi:acetyltransferase-like isoleucine patch superfamily enzyme